MESESVRFRERTTISFPDGTQGRIRAVAAERGMKATQFLRQVVLERLEEEEDDRRRARPMPPRRHALRA